MPGPKDLWVVSVHLLTASSCVRNTEATNLVNFIKANVPAADYLVVGGDFNTDSRSEACLLHLLAGGVDGRPVPGGPQRQHQHQRAAAASRTITCWWTTI